jgi:cyclohexa-1,5-dienecarbonyl-CoA hydratase
MGTPENGRSANEPMTPGVHLREEHGGRVARIVFANPPDNAFDIPLLEELHRALDALERWPLLACVVLEGAGLDFSTGLSLSQRRMPYVELLLPSLHAAARKLAALDVLQIALVRGRCFGAGLELSLLAHVLLADATAKFAFPELSFGAFPTLGPLLLPDRLGAARAEEWLLSGRTVPVEEALAAGLVTAFAGGWDSLETLSLRYLEQQVLARSTPSLKSLVRALGVRRRALLENELPELERLYFQRIAATKDAEEGLSAALRRRAPKWSHQ